MTDREKVYQFVPPEGLELRRLSKKRGFKNPSRYLMALIIQDLDEHNESHGFVIMGGTVSRTKPAERIVLELE